MDIESSGAIWSLLVLEDTASATSDMWILMSRLRNGYPVYVEEYALAPGRVFTLTTSCFFKRSFVTYLPSKAPQKWVEYCHQKDVELWEKENF
jgi:hypothetical protein